MVLDAGLGGRSTHFVVFKKRVFKQKFRPNMSKNTFLFWKKAPKFASALEVLPSAPC